MAQAPKRDRDLGAARAAIGALLIPLRDHSIFENLISNFAD
jgi:hypothetical protein